jgi:hypothetical protein
MLITPLPLNTRHAGPRQVAAGPGALRQLICDTTKVNTGAAETTRTDRDIEHICRQAAELTQLAGDPFSPAPRHERERRELIRLRAIIAEHDGTRPDTDVPA